MIYEDTGGRGRDLLFAIECGKNSIATMSSQLKSEGTICYVLWDRARNINIHGIRIDRSLTGSTV